MYIRLFPILTILLLSSPYIYAQDQKEDAKKVNFDFELELEGQYRFFFKDGAFPDQRQHFPANAIIPELSIDWNDGYESINFKGFYRFDRDSKRTHGDIRELYYQKAKNKWELNVGLKKIYWGVTESNHLVDIINQTDQVESFDGEDKLGQPMVQFTWTTDRIGSFDFFYLPYHRKRTFAGPKGRLRFGMVIDQDDIGYESGAKEWRQDFAIRWSHYIGVLDIGLSHFYGSGREPLFAFNPDGSINAFYPVIHQTGLELQITHNAFLWKVESIYRQADVQDVFAFVAGVEYTFSNIDDNGLDIGLLAEYLFDDRDEFALNALQNDIFVGSRIALNDTQDSSILFGGIFDLESSSKIFSVEASRRFGSSWTAALETRIFSGIPDNDFILRNFKEDSFVNISVSKFF